MSKITKFYHMMKINFPKMYDLGKVKRDADTDVKLGI